MANILHMETDTIRGSVSSLMSGTDQIREQIRHLDASIIGVNWQSASREEFENNFQSLNTRFQILFDEFTLLMQRLGREVDEWESVAANLANGTSISSFSLRGIVESQKFTDFVNENSWQVILNGNGKPVITFADGRQLDLSKLQDGDVDSLTLLGELLEKQGTVANIAEQIAEGKWVDVSGYFNSRSGNWVSDYSRTLPGGRALADKLGAVGDVVDAGDVGLSLIAALTDKKEAQWVEIPLGQVDGKPIVYSLYVPPKDHWRDFWTKIGKVGGSGVGTIAGGLGGALTLEVAGPVGPVLGGITGNHYGGELGKNLAEQLYDSLAPKVIVPPNPHSNMIETGITTSGNHSSIYLNQNPEADVIDLARIVQAGDGQVSTQVKYTVGQDGKPHLEVIAIPVY